MNKIELLAPAGDMERLQMAVAYGADAVYLAGNTFGMRTFAGNFSPEALKAADPMTWVGRMNNIRSCAEEIVLHDLVYAY